VSCKQSNFVSDALYCVCYMRFIVDSPTMITMMTTMTPTRIIHICKNVEISILKLHELTVTLFTFCIGLVDIE